MLSRLQIHEVFWFLHKTPSSPLVVGHSKLQGLQTYSHCQDRPLQNKLFVWELLHSKCQSDRSRVWPWHQQCQLHSNVMSLVKFPSGQRLHTTESFHLHHRLKLAFLKEGETGQASSFRIQRLKFANGCSFVFIERKLCHQAVKWNKLAETTDQHNISSLLAWNWKLPSLQGQ